MKDVGESEMMMDSKVDGGEKRDLRTGVDEIEMMNG